MENLYLFLILFIIFFIIFLVDYFIKRKKNKLKKFIGMELVKVKKEDYNKLGIILSIINAFIISSTGVLCTMIEMEKIWQLLYGFVLLVALIYVFYGIIENILERIYKRRKK